MTKPSKAQTPSRERRDTPSVGGQHTDGEAGAQEGESHPREEIQTGGDERPQREAEQRRRQWRELG